MPHVIPLQKLNRIRMDKSFIWISFLVGLTSVLTYHVLHDPLSNHAPQRGCDGCHNCVRDAKPPHQILASSSTTGQIQASMRRWLKERCQRNEGSCPYHNECRPSVHLGLACSEPRFGLRS